MTNKKAKLSDDAKASIKEALEMQSGGIEMSKIRILPANTHTKGDYLEIVDVIRSGKAWILPFNASRNTIYNLRKALSNPTATWNTEKDSKDATKTTLRKDAIKKVLFGEVLLIDGETQKPTKNTALYLP